MPEGDTIRRLAERINRRFAGERCERSVTRDPRLVHVDFAGTVLREADAHGKHLLIRFDDGRTLFAHLRMDGSFTVGPAATESAWRRRVELWMETGRLTGIDVPVLGVVQTADEDQIVGHLGPDLCGPELPDLDDVLERIAEQPDAPLAGALLDQRNVAGFGNVYAVELPFVVGVSPNQPVGIGRGPARPARPRRRRHPHQRGAGPAEHDRPQAAGRRPLDLRPARPAVPAVRHPPRRLGRARQPVAPGRHVVPVVPAGRAEPRPVDLVRARRLLALHPARREPTFPAEPDRRARPGRSPGAVLRRRTMRWHGPRPSMRTLTCARPQRQRTIDGWSNPTPLAHPVRLDDLIDAIPPRPSRRARPAERRRARRRAPRRRRRSPRRALRRPGPSLGCVVERHRAQHGRHEAGGAAAVRGQGPERPGDARPDAGLRPLHAAGPQRGGRRPRRGPGGRAAPRSRPPTSRSVCSASPTPWPCS